MDPAQGGPPSAVSGLAAAQASIGHEVTIFCHKAGTDQAELQSSLAGVPSLDKVKFVECEQRLSKLDEIFCLSAKRRMRELLCGTSIVHIHGLWRPILGNAIKLARQAGIPYVVTPHGMLTPWSLKQKRVKKRIALSVIWKRALLNAAFLHMLSEEESTLSKFNPKSNAIKIIPNGIYVQKLDDPEENGTFYTRYPDLKRRPYVIFLGRLHYVKGLDYLIDAFTLVTERNDDVDLVLVGPDGGHKATLLKQAEDLGVKERVHFVGSLYGKEKYDALGGALCLCQTSRQEGFSMTILEALSVGKPVVISEACRFPEVADVGAGAVVSSDAQMISSAMENYINDADLRERAGRAARELVEKQYSWTRIAEKMIRAYEEARVKAEKIVAAVG
jgi:glycosyltransferase involved in cell wall biosynthesis